MCVTVRVSMCMAIRMGICLVMRVGIRLVMHASIRTELTMDMYVDSRVGIPVHVNGRVLERSL